MQDASIEVDLLLFGGKVLTGTTTRNPGTRHVYGWETGLLNEFRGERVKSARSHNDSGIFQKPAKLG
jgi:hypothetical protein